MKASAIARGVGGVPMLVQSRSMRGSGGSPGVSSGSSQTSNHAVSNLPTSVVYRRSKRRPGSRTARNAAADNTGRCYTCIEKFGLLLRLDFNTAEFAHLAHFTPDLTRHIDCSCGIFGFASHYSTRQVDHPREQM
jgi:hypothetical protein